MTDVLNTKPLDWDDREYIPDPKHIAKPDDYELKHKWMTIPDVNAIKPEGWGDRTCNHLLKIHWPVNLCIGMTKRMENG